MSYGIISILHLCKYRVQRILFADYVYEMSSEILPKVTFPENVRQICNPFCNFANKVLALSRNCENKKYELMLTRREKAYIALPVRKLSVYLQLFSRKTGQQVNNGKITTFTGVPLFDALVRRSP